MFPRHWVCLHKLLSKWTRYTARPFWVQLGFRTLPINFFIRHYTIYCWLYMFPIRWVCVFIYVWYHTQSVYLWVRQNRLQIALHLIYPIYHFPTHWVCVHTFLKWTRCTAHFFGANPKLGYCSIYTIVYVSLYSCTIYVSNTLSVFSPFHTASVLRVNFPIFPYRGCDCASRYKIISIFVYTTDF